MKTVVIIENEVVERKALINLFEKWHRKLNVLAAANEQAAISIMSRNQADLVICDLALSEKGDFENFSLLTQSFPYVPCIVLSPAKGITSKESIKRGASCLIEKPINPSQLLRQAEELLNIGTSGTIRGIPIHSFLQMLESEEKTCTLRLKRKTDVGLLYLKNGVLIGAETKKDTGEEAAHLILTWQDPVIEIRYFNGQKKKQISRPLLSVITEAFQLKNKKEKQLRKTLMDGVHQLPLKHFPTIGKRIPLEIGSQVKLEFPNLDFTLESVLVGMLQDKYIIISTPKRLSELKELADVDQRIILKYNHRGRVWMFKSQLLKTLESPYHLLFFEYPQVLHYHELRQTERAPIFIPCTFHLPSKSELYGVLIDMSITGGLCLIKHKADTSLPPITRNTKVTLRCLLPGIKEEQEINGMVRNTKTDHTDTKIGIEFENLQPHLTETIGRYLHSIEGLTDHP